MWNVEELSIQHQAQKVTVLNVKKYASPAGKTDGLGLLYMGYQSVFLGRQFRPSITLSSRGDATDNELDDYPSQTSNIPQTATDVSTLSLAPELDTILDTGRLKLLKPIASHSNVSDHQVQTDLSMPIWVLNNIGKNILSTEVSEGVNSNALEVVSGNASQKLSPIDVNSCEQFSVIHYEHVGKPVEKSMVMVQTHNRDQTKSVCLFDVNENENKKTVNQNRLLDGSGDASESLAQSVAKQRKPFSTHNKHAYTSQYESLSEYSKLSPNSSNNTSSCEASPDDSESPYQESTSSSSTGFISSSDDYSPGNAYPGVMPSQSIDSDLVSLLSTPSEEEAHKVPTPEGGEISIWDRIQSGRLSDVIQEEDCGDSAIDSLSLVADVQEIAIDSVSIPLHSTNDKPAISYKAYKVHPDTNEVILSKAKIATYLPLMTVAPTAIEGNTVAQEVDSERKDVKEVRCEPNTEPLSSRNDLHSNRDKIDSDCTGSKLDTSDKVHPGMGHSSDCQPQFNLDSNKSNVMNNLAINNEFVEKRSSILHRRNGDSVCSPHSSDTDTRVKMASASNGSFKSQDISVHSGGKHDDTDGKYRSRDSFDDSLTIYLKSTGKRPVKRGSLTLEGQLHHRPASSTGKARQVGVMSKTYASNRPSSVQGLNQFQTVVSKTSQRRKSEKRDVGLNEFSSSPVLGKKKPQLQVSLLSPGGSTTSEDDGNQPGVRSGSRMSTESDISPGAYLMASYDDGSDWGDDSLLWNTDSVESLTSYTSDTHYDTGVIDCEVHPHWMAELPSRLHTVPITGLVIPGSHISFAIERDLRPDMDISKCNYEMAEFLRKLPNLSIFNSFRSMIKKIWKSWMGKQMLTVSQQLYAGVRYLDLRITKYRSALYAEHGLYSQQLPKYLKEIKLFTETHSKEVVILHFGALNQIDQKDKRRLVTMLFQVFGAKLAQRPNELNEVTLQALWSKRKQVILIFPESDLRLLDNHIFAGLIWPDSLVQVKQSESHTVPELISFLDNVYCQDLCISQGASKSRRGFHVMRAVLSPDMSLVFGDYHYSGMREMTLEDTHPAVHQWLKGKSNLNIVALDFVGKGDLIEKIICLNHAKFVKTTTV